MKRMLVRAAVVAALALSAVVLPGAARAAPPLNDNFASATVISALPFSDTVDVTDATFEGGEPACTGPVDEKSVWYDFTPAASQVLRLQATGQSSTTLAVYTGSSVGVLSGVSGCSYFGQPVLLNAVGGTTYHIRVAAFPFDFGGLLTLQVVSIPPPANDDFANATPVGALPFNDNVDTTGATSEPNEPVPSCTFGSLTGSVWYAFTPTQSGSVSARAFQGGFSTGLAAYTGSSLGSLAERGCKVFGDLLTIHVDAGTTYYFQAGGIFGGKGGLQVRIDVAPEPVANFSFDPSDPSIFDSPRFNDASSDPGGVGVNAWMWSFGDGATATTQSPQHQYAHDGDYSVKLTVTTSDGRSASVTQVVHVRTHDVAIGSLSVPAKGRVGRSSPITVGVSNMRYPETVQVQLYVSSPSGFQLVGTLTQTIPVTGHKKTIPFSFNYTFTAADASVGKVTFQAVAWVVGARDALPSDNAAISLPVSVAT